ncbi:hypothetical protein AMK16_21620 [Streptomyces sp. CB00455]|uniref:hypothetical protein n=1 Tax=Streptomyces sp. CB00455 TaxID=1703927 RepID=UPI0009395E0E|nr:hypothetical protein [Streptomyces sp. CB00455]OKK17435.1 hypothetical protein AMK16_21620 [Streptomyces sp. CB00455]
MANGRTPPPSDRADTGGTGSGRPVRDLPATGPAARPAAGPAAGPTARLTAELAAAEAREADLRAAHEFYAAERQQDRIAVLRLELDRLHAPR